MSPEHIRKPIPTAAWILFAGAFLLFLIYAIPGLIRPEFLMRIDSATYLGPARSLLSTFSYKSSPEAVVPTGLRVPLYPMWLSFSLLIGGKSLWFCVIMNCLISAIAIPVVYLAGRELSQKELPSVLAAMFLLLSPTEIAFAPMFLSEGMFVTLISFEILFFLRYFKRKSGTDLFLSVLFAGLATLTRPLNILWIFPCLFAAAFIPGIPLKKKCFHLSVCFLGFVFVVFPWIYRNHSIGSGWRIDEVSADSLRHNAAVVESRVNRMPAQFYREKYAIYFEKEFQNRQKYPTADARLTFEEQKLTDILMRHKLIYFSLFFNPTKLIPDAPTFLENLNLTSGGLGTWDVIIKDGLWAGIRHYFHGRMLLPFLLLPLLLIQLCAYLGAAGELVFTILRKNYLIALFFLLFCVYYLTVIGPGGYPRFQLPAMPFLCILAGSFFNRIHEYYREKKS